MTRLFGRSTEPTRKAHLQTERAAGAAPIYQLLSGEAAKVDPVANGKGTVLFHANHGYTRLTVTRESLHIEVKDRRGASVYTFSIPSL